MTNPTPEIDRQELAALYLSGAMTPDERASYRRRLADDDGNDRAALEQLQDALGVVAGAAPTVAPAPALRAAILEKIKSEEDSRQPWRAWSKTDPEELFTLRADEGEWKAMDTPGVEVRRLFVDVENNRLTAMFRMAPGAEYPSHRHDGDEERYVLQGDLHVGDTVMHAGDYQRAPASSHHGVQRTEGGCLLLVTCALTDEMDEHGHGHGH